METIIFFFNPLKLIFICNFVTICCLIIINDKQYLSFFRWVTLIVSIMIFFLSLSLVFFYNHFTSAFQYYFFLTDLLQFGIDGISLSFLLLTTFLFPIFFLVIWDIVYEVRRLLLILMFLEFFLILVFTVLDLFSFYVFFELILIPMIYLIAIWGVDERRLIAIYYFFLYTLFGSLCLLTGLILIYYECGTTNINILLYTNINVEKQKILWLLFFLPLAIKIPMVPGHLWLLEAHPEAPTVGSMILASLLLKMGSFGFLRILLSIFADATEYFRPLVIILGLCGLIYSSLILLRQYDIKRIIAYSSIAHMNYGILGMFSDTMEGLTGGVILMIAHGFTSSALFFLAGCLYERFHERNIYNYSGLTILMPILSTFFLLFVLSNFGFPGTINFLGEVLIILGFFEKSPTICFIASFGLFLSLIYSILLFNRIFWGSLQVGTQYSQTNKFTYFSDLSKKELFILFSLSFIILWLGLYCGLLVKLVINSLFVCLF